MTTPAGLSAEQLELLQEQLGYRFRDLPLLRRALVHKSWLNEAASTALDANERLEFLGDAVLGAVVARELYERFPDTSEGWLTVSRSQLVRNLTLARVAASFDLGSYLLMGAGIANEGARSSPRVLSRTLEALFGAVWLDGGDEAARSLILRLLADEFTAIRATEIRRDAKSRLQLHCQAETGSLPQYEIVGQSGPAHDRWFRAQVSIAGQVFGRGEGGSKQIAEMAAAGAALERLSTEEQITTEP